MAAYEIERVTSVHHWNESLFTFTCTRGASLRFESGHFVMVGLMVNDKPLLRAYSIASAHYAEELEFFSIKVEDGPLTSRLQHLKVGDEVLVGRKPTGTLVLSDLLPGKHLYLFATGTGLAPFMSIIRDPDTYDRFDKVVLVHGVRIGSELAYAKFIEAELPHDDFLGEQVRQLMQTELDAAVAVYGQQPYRWGELWQRMKENRRFFPFFLPFAWPAAFTEFERLYVKEGRRNFRMQLDKPGAWLKMMWRNPITLAYFIPLIGWIPLAIKGYRGNKLGQKP